ncbi:MAG: CPBP family intramembrane glutamic endopeptidase [Syntrophomonas sp.]
MQRTGLKPTVHNVIGLAINIIPTLGEELGWRGYLLPKLRMLLSDRAALIVTGLIWGVWHLPCVHLPSSCLP